MPFPILRKILGMAVKANPVADVAFTVLEPVIQNALVRHGEIVAARAAPDSMAPPMPVGQSMVANTTVDVQNAIANNGMAIVPVKSGLFSKISWTQIAAIAASILAAFGLNLSTDQIVAVVMGVQAVQSIATIIIRTYFTKSVTASSMKGQ